MRKAGRIVMAIIGIGVFLLLIFMSGVKDSSYGSTSPYGSSYDKYCYYKTNSSSYKSTGGTGNSSSGGTSSSHHSSSSAYESHKSYDAGYNAIYEDYDILDGEQWVLRYRESGKKVKTIEGSNDYPNEWDKLIELIENVAPVQLYEEEEEKQKVEVLS